MTLGTHPHRQRASNAKHKLYIPFHSTAVDGALPFAYACGFIEQS